MNFKFLLVLAMLFFSVSIFSQNPGKISGTVIDKTSKSPIEGADVTLHSIKDSAHVKGTNSDKDGKFIFSEISPGEYFVKANIVGYSFAVVKGIKLDAGNSAIELEPIKLAQGTATTEEILVESEKSEIQFQADKKIFNVSQNPMSQSGSLADLLKNIPSVSLDADGNISLRGNTNVKILVDGKPFGMEGQNRSNLIEQIPASGVESIELITNPSSKYEAEGVSGIINIVLKKNKVFGYNGNASVNAGTGDKYGGSFNLNLKNDKVQLFANYNYNLFNHVITGGSERTNSLSTTAKLLTQDNDGHFRFKTHFVKSGFDFYADPKNTLSLTATYQNTARVRSELITSKEFDINNNLTSHFTRDYDGDIKSKNLDLALNYTLKFKNPKQSLTADAIYSLSQNQEDGYTIENDIMPQTVNPEQVKEFSKTKDQDFSIQSDYIHPTGEESKFEIGFKVRYRKKQNDYTNQKYDYNLNQFVIDPALTNNFDYRDYVNAAYAQYSGTFGIFSYQAGIRAEQTITKGVLEATNEEFKHSYIDFFPSAHISAKLSKSNEVQLSYSRRIRRPNMYELNPFINTADPNNYFSGNHNLKPEYTDSYEISVIQFLPLQTSITPSLFYRYTKDLISRTREYIDSNTTLTSIVNYSSSKSYGIELIFSSQPLKFWSINGSVSYFKTDVDATNISSAYTNEGSTWSGRVSSSLFLPLQFSLQLNYFYSGDILAAQATITPFQSFDAALRKDMFDGKLSAAFKVSDIFNTLRFKVNINNDASFREILERKRDTRIFNLSVSYKFGEADKNQQRRRKDSNRENQGNDGFGF